MRGWWLSLLCAGCGFDVCKALDVECFITHLTMASGGQQMSLVQVKQSSIERGLQPGTKPSMVPMNDLANQLPKGYSSIGCYQDQSAARDLDGPSHWSASQTVESCAAFCAGSVYFGLQDSNWCYCGNQVGRYGTAAAGQCNFPCSGSTAEMCGGYLRSSVYQFAGTSPRDLGVATVNDLSMAPATLVFTPSIHVDVMSVTMSADNPAPINVAFGDQNGCTPTLCFGFCSSASRCSSTRVCTHTVRDGLLAGTFSAKLNPNSEPDSSATELQLQIDSFGSPDCADFPNLIQLLEQSGFESQMPLPAAGDSANILATINKAAGSSSNNPMGNAQCSDTGTSCSRCTIKGCASSGVGGCGSAWYDTSDGQRFTCASCSDCSAAASAATAHCCQ